MWGSSLPVHLTGSTLHSTTQGRTKQGRVAGWWSLRCKIQWTSQSEAERVGPGDRDEGRKRNTASLLTLLISPPPLLLQA